METDVAYVVIVSFYFILACLAPSEGQKMFSRVILIFEMARVSFLSVGSVSRVTFGKRPRR